MPRNRRERILINYDFARDLLASKNDLFATPENRKELNDWLQALNGSEAMAAMTAVGMTLNFIAENLERDRK